MKDESYWSQLLTPEELAPMLRVKIGTLYSWRTRGMGPPAIKVGGFVRYRRRDVDRWLDQQTKP